MVSGKFRRTTRSLCVRRHSSSLVRGFCRPAKSAVCTPDRRRADQYRRGAPTGHCSGLSRRCRSGSYARRLKKAGAHRASHNAPKHRTMRRAMTSSPFPSSSRVRVSDRERTSGGLHFPLFSLATGGHPLKRSCVRADCAERFRGRRCAVFPVFRKSVT